MLRLPLAITGLTLALAMMVPGAAAGADPSRPADLSVEQLAEKVRPSVVVITVRGRDGKREGLGTGFVVSTDGLIATNRHVIGEGRALGVETADGKKYDVTEIHASDRQLDLAVVRIAAKGLPALPLGDSTTLKDGQAVVALGNPQGLKNSAPSARWMPTSGSR
jgi:S1-C subfamily serine protease